MKAVNFMKSLTYSFDEKSENSKPGVSGVLVESDDEDKLGELEFPEFSELQLDEEEGNAIRENHGKGSTPEIYLNRLKRRSFLVGEMRKAYLRDVVLLKMVLLEYLAANERDFIIQKWANSVPSLDLRQHLMLYSPKESSLDVIPCEACGGSVEIIHHDSSEIQELSKALSHLDKNKNELRVIIAKKNAELEAIKLRIEDESRSHRDEVL
jgi:hypothetical protein